MIRITSIFLAPLLILTGCESTDRVLTNAERVLGSRTSRTVLDIATGKDPKLILKERVDAYQRDPEAVIRDLRTIQRDFNTLMTALTGRVRQTWGEKEVKVPEQKKYVKYLMIIPVEVMILYFHSDLDRVIQHLNIAIFN